MPLPRITKPVMSLPYFRVTGLQTFEKCPYRWAVEFLHDKRGPDNIFSTSGTLIHKALELTCLKKQNPNSVEDLKLKNSINAAKHFLKVNFPENEQENFDYYLNNFNEVLSSGYQIVATEFEFDLMFDPNFPIIRGHIDLIMIAPDGIIEIWDYKTNRVEESIGEWEQKLQPLIYTYALRRILQKHFNLDHVDIRYCIGYINHRKNIKWLTTKLHDDICFRRVNNIFERIKHFSYDNNWHTEINSECKYCPVRLSCEKYISYTADAAKNMGLHPNLDTSKKPGIKFLNELRLSKKLIDGEIKTQEDFLKKSIMELTGKELSPGSYTVDGETVIIETPKPMREVNVSRLFEIIDGHDLDIEYIQNFFKITVSDLDKVIERHPDKKEDILTSVRLKKSENFNVK